MPIPAITVINDIFLMTQDTVMVFATFPIWTGLIEHLKKLTCTRSNYPCIEELVIIYFI